MNASVAAALGLASASESVAVFSGGRLFSSVMALLLVLLLILAIAWMLKRFNLVATTESRSLKVLEVLSIGQRERLLVIDWEGQRLLIAQGGSGVTCLAGPLPVKPAATPVDFASSLAEQRLEAICSAH